MNKAYTVAKLEDIDDVLGDYPGEMKMMKNALETTQIALTHRHMPAKTGGKGSYGHRHKTQEEIIFVIQGQIQVKVNDDIIELASKSAIRIAPGAIQATWNEGPEDAEIVIFSNRVPDLKAEFESFADFWPAN
ncbi:MAG TPA: cupin domain-containing protein [Candidatus Polarisedimenticolaceae bacterium]|nr:cupin domain-containing protein [Candidatus Polarisedimenticolaceae bacterium]